VTTETRLATLEERIAHQDRAIEDLNQTITDQWKLIESLKRELGRLTDQMRDVENALEQGSAKEPPPPHY
jgi:SlyX protein